MNRDEVIRLTMEANAKEDSPGDSTELSGDSIERFADLVEKATIERLRVQPANLEDMINRIKNARP